MSEVEVQDRRRFLRRLASTLAVGVGFAIFPQSAHAQVTCCPNSSMCDPCDAPYTPVYCFQAGCCACMEETECRTHQHSPC